MSSQCVHKPASGAPAAPIGRRVGLAADSGRARVRFRGAAVLAVCGAMLCAARWLEPRASGYGTHTQLGMPACSFLVRTGIPCPTCGLTTSMALTARGRLGRALAAHPFGVFLFAAAATLAAAGGVELASGRDMIRKFRPSVWWAVLFVAGILAGWGCNLLVGYSTGRLPIR